MELKKHIAVLCNYHLLPDRIGGMDHFFWAFQEKCNDNNVLVEWFFPNSTDIIEYSEFKINASEDESVEDYFLNFLQNEKIKYSHIFTHFLELCTPFFKAVKNLSEAKIITIDHNPRPLKGYPLKKQLKKRLKGLLYGKYIDVFVGVSEYTKHHILKDFGNYLNGKTFVIYNGISLDDVSYKKNRKNIPQPKFIIASHLRESKGIQDLITAVFKLPKKIRNKFRVDIYGDGPFREKLEYLTTKKNLEEQFEFKGSVNNLKRILSDYDIMLHPTRMECFSLSILESLAANVPVVTTDVGGNEEVIKNGENGYIFQAQNIEQLSQKLSELYEGNYSLIHDTRQLIEDKFSLEKMTENYLNLIK